MNYYPHRSEDFNPSVRPSALPMVYAVATDCFKYVKIGRTTGIKQRLINLQSGCPFNIRLWLAIRTPIANEVEQSMLLEFRSCRSRGEWFTPSEADLDRMAKIFDATNRHIKEVRSALL